MLFLDDDGYRFVSYLIKTKEPKTIMYISKTLGISRRKIYYIIEKLNEAISPEIKQIESIPRVGILFNEQQKEYGKNLLKTLDDYNYILSSDERDDLIMINILISQTKITINKLIKISDVSRNTIIKDLNNIRKTLENYSADLSLNVNKKKGYLIDGRLLDLVQFMYSLMYSIYLNENKKYIEILEKSLIVEDDIGKLFDKNIQGEIYKKIKKVEIDWGKKINSSDIDFLIKVLPYIILTYKKNILEKNQEEFFLELASVVERLEYKISKKISKFIYDEYEIYLDKNEEALLAMLLLSIRKDKDIHTQTLDFKYIEDAVENFLIEFEKNTNYSFYQKNELSERLLIHCKALIFRKNYKILSKNPLTTQIKEKYKEIFDITAKLIYIFEDKWNIKMNDDDIAYIVVHIGGSILDVSYKENVRKVTIVSNEGVAIQRLIIKQIKDYFPNLIIDSVLNMTQYYSVEDLLDVDFVICTHKEFDSKIPSVKVNAVLSSDDILKIVGIINYSESDENTLIFSNELERLVNEYIKDERDKKAFISRVNRLLSDTVFKNILNRENHFKDQK